MIQFGAKGEQTVDGVIPPTAVERHGLKIIHRAAGGSSETGDNGYTSAAVSVGIIDEGGTENHGVGTAGGGIAAEAEITEAVSDIMTVVDLYAL